MIIASSLVNGFQKEIQKKVFGFWAHIHVMPYSMQHSLKELPIYVKQDFYLHPERFPEITHIQQTATKGALINTKDEFEGIILRGTGPDYDWNMFKPFIVKGNIPSEKIIEGQSRPILISESTSKRMKLGLHDKVILSFMEYPIRMKQFQVCGIYNSGLDEFDRQYAMIPLDIIQDLNGWGRDSVGGFEIYIKPELLSRSKLKTYFMVLFGSLMSDEQYKEIQKDHLDVVSTNLYFGMKSNKLDVKTIKELQPSIFDWLYLQSLNEVIILIIMFIVAILNLSTALLILILERTNMIGTLKALGAGNLAIQKIFLVNAAIIIGLGLLLGNVFGIGLCELQQHFHLIKLPPESYYVSEAPIDLDWLWILGINIIAMLICLAAMVIPSLLVSFITPIKAIRFR
jgi:lipoprotein-releasing system permease protein